MPKQDIKNLSFQELAAYLESIGEKNFRANQIFDWIYKKGVRNFTGMKNLPDPLKKKLGENFVLEDQTLVKKEVARDTTTKFLFGLYDKEKVESVLIPSKASVTACISTQAGCKFGCRFCASGIGGWNRNLSCAEIVGQILYVKESAKEKHPLTNIVFMGIGEPFDNYDNLIKAIRIINSPQGINIGARKITISTCGLIPEIKQLIKENIQIELAISLHGSNQQMRNLVMPVNRKYPLAELIDVCRQYSTVTKRQITFEYILIKDLTCTLKAAEELGKLLKGILCKMNLIPYNPVTEFPHEPPAKLEAIAFKTKLKELGIHATIRTPRGRDIQGACGQLRHSAEINK